MHTHEINLQSRGRTTIRQVRCTVIHTCTLGLSLPPNPPYHHPSNGGGVSWGKKEASASWKKKSVDLRGSFSSIRDCREKIGKANFVSHCLIGGIAGSECATYFEPGFFDSKSKMLTTTLINDAIVNQDGSISLLSKLSRGRF